MHSKKEIDNNPKNRPTGRTVILALESSCDDTSAAVLVDGKVLSNVTAGQEVHIRYGGVVPELASRAHLEHIVPVVHQALAKAQIHKSELTAIAVTHGPGLLGPLLVGTNFAKSLALSLEVPLIPVNHMQAHVLAHFIEEPKPSFPFLCLTVSGGHTQLVYVKSPLEMEIVGQTLDDAAGEAFDKTGKLLGLDYPAGPLIDRLAAQGNPTAFSFPKSQLEGFNFSFSGFKTAVLNFVNNHKQKDPTFIERNLPDICASIQATIVSMLIDKLEKSALTYEVNQIAIAGGVSANRGLRHAANQLAEKQGWEVFIPKLEYCTDNAGMIAMAAHFLQKEGVIAGLDFVPDARLKF